MPDQPAAGPRQIVALVMVISAITLFVIAYLAFTGVVPLPEETRPIAGGVIAAAALLDLVIGFWFFSKGQSS